jgi:hypothetical protein
LKPEPKGERRRRKQRTRASVRVDGAEQAAWKRRGTVLMSMNLKRYPWDIQHLVISLAYL